MLPLMVQMRWMLTSTASREEGELEIMTYVSLIHLPCRGCQTQEKVVAASAETFVVIADYRYAD